MSSQFATTEISQIFKKDVRYSEISNSMMTNVLVKRRLHQYDRTVAIPRCMTMSVMRCESCSLCRMLRCRTTALITVTPPTSLTASRPVLFSSFEVCMFYLCFQLQRIVLSDIVLQLLAFSFIFAITCEPLASL